MWSLTSFSLSDRSLISSSYLSSFSEYYGKTNPEAALKGGKEAGEVPQRLRAFVVFTEGRGSGPSTHTEAHDHLFSARGSDTLPCRADIHAGKALTHVK